MRRFPLSPLVFAGLLVCSPARSTEPTKKQCVQANDDGQDLSLAGKLQQARERFALCASASCPAVVRDDCRQRMTDVDAAMPSIVFEVKDALGNDVSGVKVTMDGRPFVDWLDETPRPLDPGEHKFVFNALGRPRTELVVVVHEGDKAWHERVVMGTTPAPAPAPERPAAPVAPASDGTTQRMVGVALGGAGVVGLLVGGILGVVAKATYDHALGSECGNNPSTCSSQGVQDGHTAHSQATVATAGLIAGVAMLGGGAYLYFAATAAGGVSVGPDVGNSNAGVSVRGHW
jgi:serine/threonine-protein kinase